MMYAGSTTLRGLGWVVMDEVHYLADRFRGAVWEEVIIHLPPDVSVVSLSATVSNAEEFGAWLGEVRGDTEVIVSEHRPVPLWQHMMVGQTLFDLFVEERDAGDGPTSTSSARTSGCSVSGQPRPRARHPRHRGAWGVGLALGQLRGGRQGPRQGRLPRPRRLVGRGRSRRRVAAGRGSDRRRRASWPRSSGARAAAASSRGGRPGGGATRAEVIERLEREGLLPGDHLHLQPRRLRRRRGPAAARAGCASSPSRGRAQPAPRRGAHPGPGRRGPRRCSATGTSSTASPAASPPTTPACCRPSARSSRSSSPRAASRPSSPPRRWRSASTCRRARSCSRSSSSSTARATSTSRPAEYTQLTGRAGRRGIDIEGHAVVLWNRGLDPAGRRRPRLDAHLPAALELPADVQHGRQPRAPVRPRHGPARSSRRRSRSSRPTAPSSASSARSAATRRLSPATPSR